MLVLAMSCSCGAIAWICSRYLHANDCMLTAREHTVCAVNVRRGC